jgi:hypothetical protein
VKFPRRPAFGISPSRERNHFRACENPANPVSAFLLLPLAKSKANISHHGGCNFGTLLMFVT